MEPPRVRVGPRERLTVTATVREVDGWWVAARIAGLPLAEWAVEALNRAAVAAVGGRVELGDEAGAGVRGSGVALCRGAPRPPLRLSQARGGPWKGLSPGSAR